MALQVPCDALFGTSAARLWAAGCRPTAGRAPTSSILISKTVQLSASRCKYLKALRRSSTRRRSEGLHGERWRSWAEALSRSERTCTQSFDLWSLVQAHVPRARIRSRRSRLWQVGFVSLSEEEDLAQLQQKLLGWGTATATARHPWFGFAAEEEPGAGNRLTGLAARGRPRAPQGQDMSSGMESTMPSSPRSSRCVRRAKSAEMHGSAAG